MEEEAFREAERRLWRSEGIAPSEQRVHLGRTGVTVRVQEVGDPDGAPVVFVHGGSNVGASWASLAARLEGFRCLLLDRPGCGLSDPLPAPFGDFEKFGRFADTFLVDVLDSLTLTQAHVVATSFGGYFALRAAAAHPDRLLRMVEFGWAVGAPMAKLPAVMRIAAVRPLGRLMTSMPASESMVRRMFRQIGLAQALAAGRVSQETVDCFRAMLNHTDTMRNELEAGPRFMTPLRGFDRRILLPDELLARVQVPVKFIWGEEDPFGGADIARAFAALVPNSELELVPGAGHAVWIDDPDSSAKAVDDFLR